MKYFKNALIAGATALALQGCSDAGTAGGGDQPTMKLSGILGTSYQKADLLRAVTGVSEVWAVPVFSSGSDTFAGFDHASKATVLDDRTFELAVPVDTDYVLLLMDPSGTDRRTHIKGYVSLTDVANTVSMLYMPVSKAVDSQMALGTLEEDAASGEAQAQELTDTTAEVFQLSLDQLMELASVDDTFKSIKNQYVNGAWDGSATWYDLGLAFTWFVPYTVLEGNGTTDATLPAAHPVNVDLTPNPTTGQYSGYSIEVRTNRDLSNETICPPDGTYWTDTLTAGGTLLAIYPPAGPITHSNTAVTEDPYSPTAPISNNGGSYSPQGTNIGLGAHWGGTGCVDADFGINYQAGTDGGDGMWRFGLWGNDYLMGPVPSGEWVTKLGNTEIAWFDLAAAYPFDAAGKPTVYLPVPQVTADGTGKITAITLQWYRWNGTAYVLADPDAMAMVAGDFGVGIGDNNVDALGSGVEGYVTTQTVPSGLDLSALTTVNGTIDPTLDWYYKSDGSLETKIDPAQYHLETLAVNYRMGGVDYGFRYVWE